LAIRRPGHSQDKEESQQYGFQCIPPSFVRALKERKTIIYIYRTALYIRLIQCAVNSIRRMPTASLAHPVAQDFLGLRRRSEICGRERTIKHGR
jgi:hypothetical protein